MAFKAVGFCDLNILSNSTNLKATVLEALRLGYQTIAINTIVDDQPSYEESKSNKRESGAGKKDQCIIPPPTQLTLSDDELKHHGITGKPVLLSRLTVRYGDTSRPFLHKAKAAIEKYDIIAFTPLTEEAFKQICQTLMYVDIISLEPASEVCSIKLPRKICRLAVERDLYFELKYAPCIGTENVTAWQDTIRLSHMLSDYINSHNVFVTSGAASPEPLRSPVDVIAITRFFGLSYGAAHSAVAALCHDVVHCAQQRRAGANKCNVILNFPVNKLPSENTPRKKALLSSKNIDLKEKDLTAS